MQNSEKKMVRDAVEKRRAALRTLLLTTKIPSGEQYARRIIENWPRSREIVITAVTDDTITCERPE